MHTRWWNAGALEATSYEECGTLADSCRLALSVMRHAFLFRTATGSMQCRPPVGCFACSLLRSIKVISAAFFLFKTLSPFFGTPFDSECGAHCYQRNTSLTLIRSRRLYWRDRYKTPYRAAAHGHGRGSGAPPRAGSSCCDAGPLLWTEIHANCCGRERLGQRAQGGAAPAASTAPSPGTKETRNQHNMGRNGVGFEGSGEPRRKPRLQQ